MAHLPVRVSAGSPVQSVAKYLENACPGRPRMLSVESVISTSPTADSARAQWLRQLPLFAGADLASLELFAGAMQERACAPGEVLCRQGEQGGVGRTVEHGEGQCITRQEVRTYSAGWNGRRINDRSRSESPSAPH